MYTPEQNVMAFGTVSILANDETGGNQNQQIMGQTKTMRKMQAGDLLQFITISNVANSALVNGCIQFFCKT